MSGVGARQFPGNNRGFSPTALLAGLLPVVLAWNDGFKDHALTRIEAVVKVHRRRFLEVWHAFFKR